MTAWIALVAAVAGGVGAAAAGGAYLLGRKHGAADDPTTQLGAQVVQAAQRVDVGHSVFLEVERIGDTYLQVRTFAIGGEDE